MIPVTLKLRNFMSYGEDVPPLDFTTFDLACLSGANGHGKSALLDAITWSLWGEARKPRGQARPDDSLLRIGATEMEVEFTFDLEGRRYRVLRRYKRGRRRQTTLDLHVYDDTADRWITLTGASQSETQRKIVDILKMDYETFIASAFILQGRADEFTRKAPGERKEVLSEILGLEHYQQLAELAREHQRQCAESVRALEREVAQIDEEIGHRSEYEERERVLKSQYDELQRQLDTMAKSVEKLRERIAQLQQARQRVAELNEQITAVQRELDALRRQASQDERRVEQLQKLLAKRLDIERNYREYQTALALNAELTEKLQTLNQLQGQRQRLERAIEHARNQLERQLARLHEQRKALEQVVEEAQKVLAQRESIERGYRELESLRLEEERWEEKRKRWDELREREQQLERELQRERSSLEAQLQALCHRARELKVRASQEKRWQEACAKLTSELARLQALERERDELQQSIVQCERALAELAKEHATLQNTVEDANAKLKLLAEAKEPQCPLCESPLDDDHKRLLSNKLMHQLQGASEQMEALKAKRAELEGRRVALMEQVKNIEAQLKRLPEVQQELASAQQRFEDAQVARSEYEALITESKELRERIHRKDFAHELHEQLTDVRRAIEAVGYDSERHAQVREALRRMQVYEAQLARLKDAEARLNDANSRLPKLQAHIEQLTAMLTERRYAHEEQSQLMRVDERIAALGYDQHHHKVVQERIKKLEPFAQWYERLRAAEEELPHVESRLKDAQDAITAKEQQLHELRGRISALKGELTQLERLKGQLRNLEANRAMLDQQRTQLVEELGKVRERIQRCERLERERVDIIAKLEKMRREESIYGILTRAFGKDGIQALIIENAVPEIEEEANRILSRLTNNRAHITIELQRITQRGATRETLDIKIADELGTRPYELYSGGESFRIDFAIRIALAKLLARRAGTRLRFLVIDEGFGTQDSEGLNHLVEAIQSIREDFDKILVVTHLDALKDTFPVRIEVTKDPERGSYYEIVHL